MFIAITSQYCRFLCFACCQYNAFVTQRKETIECVSSVNLSFWELTLCLCALFGEEKVKGLGGDFIIITSLSFLAFYTPEIKTI